MPLPFTESVRATMVERTCGGLKKTSLPNFMNGIALRACWSRNHLRLGLQAGFGNSISNRRGPSTSPVSCVSCSFTISSLLIRCSQHTCNA